MQSEKLHGFRVFFEFQMLCNVTRLYLTRDAIVEYLLNEGEHDTLSTYDRIQLNEYALLNYTYCLNTYKFY